MKTLVLAIFTALSISSAAQVTAGTTYNTHHDIFPDTLLSYESSWPGTAQTYSLNMFGDAKMDLIFQAIWNVSSSGSRAMIRTQSVNTDVYVRFGRWDSVQSPSSDWFVTKVAKALNAGEAVDAPGAIWDNSTDAYVSLYLTDHTSGGGATKNVNDFVGGDKYVGVKYVDRDYFNGDREFYGWILVRCVSKDSCYVKEYSSNAKIVGLAEADGARFDVFPNPATSSIFISDANLVDARTMCITDLCGSKVSHEYIVSGESAQISFPQGIASGCYIVTFESGGKQITKKLLIN